MPRYFPSIDESNEWNLVGRANLQATIPDAGEIIPIPSRSFLIQNSNVLMIGLRSQTASPRWYTAGWAQQILPILPGYTSDYVAAVQSDSQRLKLGILNLVVFPKFVDNYLVQVSFPRWMRDISLEVWRYDGPDVDSPVSKQLTTTEVNASTSSVLLLPERDIRKGAIVVNNSTANLYINLAPVTSLADYLGILAPGGYYETPFNYAGPISGFWTAAVSTATVKEFF